MKAWVPIPVLLAGEQTSTRVDPAAALYAQVPEVEASEGVLDAAVWVGYAWADQPRDRAVTVVTGWDRDAVAAGAERLARAFWDAREDFGFVAPTGTFAACLDAALAPGAPRPYFVSDSGDNPTAGGSGDMTWGLTEVLAHPAFRDPDGPVLVYASVPGPAAVDTAVAAGVGATVTVTAGGRGGRRARRPVTMTGRVHAVRHGDRDADTEVVLQVGSVYAILTRLRKPYHHEHDFTDLDLSPRDADVVVVKIGYLEPELFDMAAGWMLALTRVGSTRTSSGWATTASSARCSPSTGTSRPRRTCTPGSCRRPTSRSGSSLCAGRGAGVALEVAVTSPAGAVVARDAGADRVELCSGLELGGLTPSQALVEMTHETGIPAHALVRCRPGGFVLDATEVELTEREVRTVLRSGAAGRRRRCPAPGPDPRRGRPPPLRGRGPLGQRHRRGHLHRAVDHAADPVAAAARLADLGFTRVLTSGGAASARGRARGRSPAWWRRRGRCR